MPLVIRGMVPDDGQQRCVRATRVMQVGQPVRQARTEVQQRRRRLPGHAAEAVGRAGRDPLEQAENPAHFWYRVQRRDEVHLRRTGVSKARGHAAAGVSRARKPRVRKQGASQKGASQIRTGRQEE